MVDYSLAVNEQQLDTSRHRQVTDTSAPVIQKKKKENILDLKELCHEIVCSKFKH